MGMTPGMSGVSAQNISTAAMGMMSQDRFLEAQEARKQQELDAKLQREADKNNLTMKLMADKGNLDTQIKSAENMQTLQFAENEKSRLFQEEEKQKERDHSTERENIGYKIEELNRKQMRRDKFRLLELQKELF